MSFGSAPGLGQHPSLSTDKIDHLLSVPAPTLAAVQLDRAPAPEEPRYSYDIKSINVATSNPQWQPLHLRTAFILTNVALLIFLAALIELLYFVNLNVQGMVPSHFVKTHSTFVPYLTVLPGVLGLIIIHPWFEIDRLVKVVQPYVSMSQTRTLAGSSVLLNYTDRHALLLLPKLIRNKHVTPLLTTAICILAVFVTPFSAAYIRLGTVPQDVYMNLNGVVQIDQLTLPTNFPFAQINSAVAYANAATVYGVNPPQLTLFNGAISWTAAGVDHDKYDSDGIVSANVVVLQSYPACETTTDGGFSRGILTGDAFGCSYKINTTGSGTEYESTYGDPSSFGVQPCGSDSVPDSIAPVVFWDVYINNGVSTALVTACQPNVFAHRADVLFNASNSMVLGLSNVASLKHGDTIGVPVTSSTDKNQLDTYAVHFNGTALNGLFLSFNGDADLTIMPAIQSTMAYAVDTQFRNNLASTAGFGLIGAHVDAALTAYGNFLGVAARTLYFETASTANSEGFATTGKFHPLSEQRIYVAGSVTHVLFILLVLMAVMGIAVAHYSRQDRRTYKLYAAPGSIAQAVAVAATSDLPTIVRSTDTPGDMKSVLQEYTFTLNRETGGLVLGDRDPATIPNSPTHIPMTGVGDWMKKRLSPGANSGTSSV